MKNLGIKQKRSTYNLKFINKLILFSRLDLNFSPNPHLVDIKKISNFRNKKLKQNIVKIKTYK